MKNFKWIILVAIFGLSFLLAPFFHHQHASTGVPIAYGAMADEEKGKWLDEITETLGCHCGCDLTLKECKVDDPDCRLRPALIQKLPAAAEAGGPSLLKMGGCSCGCGFTLIECQKKHTDCTQRPRIIQQLKRLSIKYGYEKNFVRNSNVPISKAEIKMFSEALEGRGSILYVHNGDGSQKSGYMKALLKFQKQHKDRLALIKISIADKAEQNILRHYRIESPSVLIVSPNGAVTAFFKGEVPVEKLKRGLVSPKMEEILLAIQQGMTIFLGVGHSGDSGFEETVKTITPAVHKLGGIATAIWVDPDDRTEKPLLSALKYKGRSNGAPVFVIAPTGLLIEKIDKGLTERRLFDSFQKILAMKSGCGQSTITGGSVCQPGYGVTGESSCQ
jgi:hypothetical protein